MGSWNKRSTGSVKKEDTWFSKAIRARDNWQCRKCGSVDTIQCAHIYARRTKSVRYHTANAVALCAACHRYFTDEPIAWARWCDQTLGAAHMEKLQMQKNRVLKTTESVRQEISDHYRTEYNRMTKDGTRSLRNWGGYPLF